VQGRFISRDPLGYVDGMGLYQYVKNSSMNHLDPLGLSIFSRCSPWRRDLSVRPRWSKTDEWGYVTRTVSIPMPGAGPVGSAIDLAQQIVGELGLSPTFEQMTPLHMLPRGSRENVWLFQAPSSRIRYICACEWEKKQLEFRYCCNWIAGSSELQERWEGTGETEVTYGFLWLPREHGPLHCACPMPF